MFKGIKSVIREARIQFDYLKLERREMSAHKAAADRRFDVGQLSREVSQIKENARIFGDQRFEEEISLLRKKIPGLEWELQQKLEQLKIFERNYKSELNALYVRKEQLLQVKGELLAESKRLKDERSRVHQALDEAYRCLEAAKSDVNSWYAKSRRTTWLFGNSGKKLPKHSMFGQSFGDLEAAKSRRSAAVCEISSCKSLLESVKRLQSDNNKKLDLNSNEVGKVIESISEVKAARQLMFNLKNEGVQPGVLRSVTYQLQASRESLEENILRLEKHRSTLIQETEIRMGIKEREAAIADLLAKKSQFLAEFHSEQNEKIRRKSHRRQWMDEHGHTVFK